MPRTAERLPQSTCGDLEAIFDSLASTGQYSAVLGHEAVEKPPTGAACAEEPILRAVASAA